MKDTMRILMGYDGSRCAEAALNDLRRAGLTKTADVVVLTVADVWLPSPASEIAALGQAIPPSDLQPRADAIGTEKEAHHLAEKAAAHLARQFPDWKITAVTCHDSPGHGILQQAAQFKPDLIVVGSHGRSALNRMLLGSVSQHVATEASCSVRLARGQLAVDVAPPRLVVAVDGSEHSHTTVDWVAGRHWPVGTAVHVLALLEGEPDVVLEPGHQAREDARLRRCAEGAVGKLRAAGLLAAAIVRPGDPRHEILREAERWGADCVFVGAHRHSRLEKILGSVSQWVTSRASCSVEVVRGTPGS